MQGQVSLYRGAIEIVPELPADVTLVAAAITTLPAATPTQAAAFLSLGQLTPADKGKLVTVRGKIAAVIPFSRGMKYRLDDGTGKVILLLWQDVLDKAPDLARLTKGTDLTVAGVVDVFEGDIEVVPKSGADVQVNR